MMTLKIKTINKYVIRLVIIGRTDMLILQLVPTSNPNKCTTPLLTLTNPAIQLAEMLLTFKSNQAKDLTREETVIGTVVKIND